MRLEDTALVGQCQWCCRLCPLDMMCMQTRLLKHKSLLCTLHCMVKHQMRQKKSQLDM